MASSRNQQQRCQANTSPSQLLGHKTRLSWEEINVVKGMQWPGRSRRLLTTLRTRSCRLFSVTRQSSGRTTYLKPRS